MAPVIRLRRISVLWIFVTYYVTTYGEVPLAAAAVEEASERERSAANPGSAPSTVAPAISGEQQTGAPADGETVDLLHLGRELFEQMAPAEVKAQFTFPTPEQWQAFTERLERALAGGSLAELGALAGEVRSTLMVLRALPGYEDLADWLEQRLDEIEGAQQATGSRPPPAQGQPLRPGAPRPAAVQPVPHYNLWLARLRARPAPARAPELMPLLRAAFAAEGVPPELAWLAEAESSLNPAARSPAGAKGLFQFMPDTAKAMGLRTFLPDERTDPPRSARAAARYLRTLHGRFGNWALVLAAYNAGEGRVGRTLAARRAATFTAIAEDLPAETRMYVPKVCALIATRTGVTPDRLAPPR